MGGWGVGEWAKAGTWGVEGDGQGTAEVQWGDGMIGRCERVALWVKATPVRLHVLVALLLPSHKSDSAPTLTPAPTLGNSRGAMGEWHEWAL